MLLSGAGCSGTSADIDGGCQGGSCDTDSGQPIYLYGGCLATFSDDFPDSTYADAGCTTLTDFPDSGYSTDAGPDWLLQFQVYSNFLKTNVSVLVDLGTEPSPGYYTQENTPNWDSVAVAPIGCEFVSGALAVPEESFNLTITSVSDLDGGSGQAHGVFSTTQYVELSVGAYCGTSAYEDVNIEF